MNWEVLLGSAAVATIVAGAISYFTYRHQKRTDLIFDYRKYILNKRIHAFERLYDILVFDKSLLRPENINELFKKDEGTGISHYDTIMKQIEILKGEMLWLTIGIENQIARMKDALINIKKYVDPTEENVARINVEGVTFFKQYKDLHMSYLKEIIRLNEIERFYNGTIEYILHFEALSPEINEIENDLKKHTKRWFELKEEYEILKRKNAGDEQKAPQSVL